MQAGLRLCCSQPGPTGFLGLRPICMLFSSPLKITQDISWVISQHIPTGIVPGYIQ